jgi:hypothetical protein
MDVNVFHHVVEGQHAPRKKKIQLQSLEARTYSAVDVMGDMLDRPTRFRNKHMRVFKSFIKEQLRLIVPSYFYLKLDLVCNRIAEGTGKRYTHQELCQHLFESFLSEYVGEEPDAFAAHRDLQDVRSLPLIVTYMQLQNVETDEDLEELYEQYELSRDYQAFKVKVPRYYILECESLLRDMEDPFPSHIYTVERVLETIYCHFAAQVVQGDAVDIIKEIYDDVRGWR